jgi:hypothetical protein
MMRNPFRRRGARNARYLVRRLARIRARANTGRHRLDKRAYAEQQRRGVAPDTLDPGGP